MLDLPKITRSIGWLIDDIYTRDDRQGLFQTFCARLEKIVPFSSAVFTPVDGKSKKILFENHLRYRVEENDVLLFCSSYASCHPVMKSSVYRALLTQRKNVPVRITDVVPVSRLSETEYFRNFLSRNAALYELFAVLGMKKSLIGCLLLQRSKQAGDFADRDREVVGILLPHLARAFQNLNIHKQMEIRLAALGESSDAVEHLNLLLTRFRLTPRQTEIAALAVLGNTNREIAARLSITEPTVKDHLESIFRRTGVRHRSELSARVLMDKAA
jgi:DNA-binding CsgD family transcriptional regulator